MSEQNLSSNPEKHRNIEDLVVGVVDWLAVIDNPNHYDGDSLRYAYYSAPQVGPVRHGGIYVGVHRVYTGEEDGGHNDWHQISLLYPPEYPYANNEYFMSISVDGGRLSIGDENGTAYARDSAGQFMDWLATAELELTARRDVRNF